MQRKPAGATERIAGEVSPARCVRAILCRQAGAARLDILLTTKDTTRLAVLILATMPIFLGGFVIGTRTRGHGGRRDERRRSRWRSAPRQRACLVLDNVEAEQAEPSGLTSNPKKAYKFRLSWNSGKDWLGESPNGLIALFSGLRGG